MWTFLLPVLGAAVIAGFVWHYRRQAAIREAASAERMKAFLEQARAEAAAQAGAKAPAGAAAPPALVATASARQPAHAQTPALTGFAPRPAMLNAEQRVLYLLLKSDLPDHVVFACVNVAAFIQPADHIAGFAREAQQRRLADAVADFVVCDKSTKPVAAVQCGTRSGKDAEAAAFAAACAAASGVRWVEISPQALPRRGQVRARVLG